MHEVSKRQQVHEDARKMHRDKILVKNFEKKKRGKRHLGGHDPVRRMDRQGEVLIRFRKCSGYARQRMEVKLMNCCKPEQMGTKEYGKMLKMIQVLEMVGSWQRRQEAEGLKDKRQELREKSIRGF